MMHAKNCGESVALTLTKAQTMTKDDPVTKDLTKDLTKALVLALTME